MTRKRSTISTPKSYDEHPHQVKYGNVSSQRSSETRREADIVS